MSRVLECLIKTLTSFLDLASSLFAPSANIQVRFPPVLPCHCNKHADLRSNQAYENPKLPGTCIFSVVWYHFVVPPGWGNAGLPDALPKVFWDFARPIVGQGALVIPTYSNPPQQKKLRKGNETPRPVQCRYSSYSLQSRKSKDWNDTMARLTSTHLYAKSCSIQEDFQPTVVCSWQHWHLLALRHLSFPLVSFNIKAPESWRIPSLSFCIDLASRDSTCYLSLSPIRHWHWQCYELASLSDVDLQL